MLEHPLLRAVKSLPGARVHGGFKPQPIKQIPPKQVARYFKEVERATKMGLDVMDFAFLERSGCDLFVMSARDMKNKLDSLNS